MSENKNCGYCQNQSICSRKILVGGDYVEINYCDCYTPVIFPEDYKVEKIK